MKNLLTQLTLFALTGLMSFSAFAQDLELPSSTNTGTLAAPSEMEDVRFRSGTVMENGRFGINFVRIIDTAFQFSIFPIVHFDSDKARTITNLCGTEEKGAWEPSSTGFTLLERECEEGYRVVQSTRSTYGFGVGAAFGYATAAGTTMSSGVSLNIGIVPMKGTALRSERFAPSRMKARSTSPLSFPYSASAIDSWEIGDNISYMSSGALFTYATVQMGGYLGPVIGSVGVSYLIQGDWIVEVTKIDETRVHLRITKSRIKAISAGAGNFAAAVSIALYKNVDDAFSYEIDLADKEGAKIYENAIRGNLVPVQELAGKGDSDAFRAVSKTHSRSRIVRKRAYVSFPLIITQEWNKGKMIKDSETYYFSDKKQMNADYGMYYQSTLRKNRRISTKYFKHINVAKGFSGTRYHVTQEDDKNYSQKGFFGEAVFSYTNDDAERGQFQKGLWHLYSATGLKEHLRIKSPVNAELGYAGISVYAYLPEGAINELISLAKNNDPAFNAFASMRSVKFYLLQMDRYKAQDGKRFAENFAHFGRFFISNRSTFKAVLALSPRLIKLRYRVEGEKFYSYERNFTYQDLSDDATDGGVWEAEENVEMAANL